MKTLKCGMSTQEFTACDVTSLLCESSLSLKGTRAKKFGYTEIYVLPFLIRRIFIPELMLLMPTGGEYAAGYRMLTYLRIKCYPLKKPA